MVAAGGAHSLATTADGRVYAFGDGRQGQLGVEPPGHATAISATGHRCCVFPAWVEALAAISPRAVACGGDFSLVVAHDGSLFSFGANSFGQLGLGCAPDQRAPCRVEALRDVAIATAAAGAGHCLAAGRPRRKPPAGPQAAERAAGAARRGSRACRCAAAVRQ
mmetsp:Transcript_35366/g.118232  ORF Transcript_35366/g.118232 Transcript_35366/m.118232 type:complete len:164 (-) Transcript_35366:616-1107(-)